MNDQTTSQDSYDSPWKEVLENYTQDNAVWLEVQRYEEANKIDYITSVERIGMRKGMQQGLEQGKREGLWRAIRLGLDLKFGAAGLPLLSEIYRIDDIALLESITDAIKTVNSPDELRSVYQLASA